MMLLPSVRAQVLGRVALCALVLMGPTRIGQAAAPDGPVALVVNTDVPAFSWARLQRAVQDAVGVPIITTDDPGTGERRGLLTITWRTSQRELAATYENVRGSISRIVPSTDDVEGAVNAAAILAVNLVRDQATEFLNSNRSPPPPPAGAPAAVATVPTQGQRPAAALEAEPTAPVATSRPALPPPRFVFTLLGGTGLGWASGVAEVHAEEVHAGLARTRAAHVLPELGLFVTPRVLMSVQVRLQFISGATDLPVTDPVVCGGDFICSAPRTAAAGFVKATLFGGAPSRALRPYVSLALGAGAIRHVVQNHGEHTCGASRTESCFDTLSGGPLLAGPGVGLHYHLAGGFSVVAGIEVQVGAPRFTLNADANVGASVRF